MPWTRTGTVVYKRRTHWFNYQDVLRIALACDPTLAPRNIVRDVNAMVGVIEATLADMLRLVDYLQLWEIVPRQKLAHAVIEVAIFLLELLARAPLLVKNEVLKMFAGAQTEEVIRDVIQIVEEEKKDAS